MSQGAENSSGIADLPKRLADVALEKAGISSPSSKGKNKAGKPKEMHTQAASKGPSAPVALPDFIKERNNLFEELKKKHDEELAKKPRSDIKITLEATKSDVSVVEGKSWETTPGQLLRNVPKEVSSDAVVAKVNDKLWDLDRPLEGDAKVSYLSSKDPEGRGVFWHSSAHVLGEAAENEYGCRLSHGPPTATGFFYDMALEEGQAVKESDWPNLESRAKKYSKEKQPFERLEVSKDDLRKMFGYSKYKMHYIEKFVPDGESSTVYRNGSLVDLCQGPHIQNTKKIEAFKIMKVSQCTRFRYSPLTMSLRTLQLIS